MFQNLTNNQNVFEIFDYKNLGQVRTSINLDTKETLFCLSDVCNVLGIINSSRVMDRLNPEGVHNMSMIDNLGRHQSANFISLSNVFKVIFTSRKPEAEAFADWVTDEVLPSIANKGYYVLGELTPQKFLEMLLKQILDNANNIKNIFARITSTTSDIETLKREISVLKDTLKKHNIF